MSDDLETPLTAVRLEKRDALVVVEERVGFLPIETNAFDRCFISAVIWVAISLLWFRFLEPLGLSIWISNAISAALAVFIVKKG
jgi:predicted small integral membrane protein